MISKLEKANTQESAKRKRVLGAIVLAVSCLLAGILQAADVKTEIKVRFEDVDNIFKKC